MEPRTPARRLAFTADATAVTVPKTGVPQLDVGGLEDVYGCARDIVFHGVVEYEVEVASSASKATKWRRLDWERDNEEMLELARNGAYKIPTHLVIRGTVKG
ncbi:hypothetical protein QBC32DRAFT_347788 [Pseudoneurospora amorphoporcata]|uniref:Uncharacterized protein n=1 Tax=Pseudoneurospora amorphoporcata TaxID=241081 RepID=A0AAN6NQH8_9PEZI|nr:hypothetical protein QBC32DRAFT_347788 [Pseudoneurospora amorphoporcata]